MTENDLQMVREWRNSEAVRTHMYTTHVISEEEHSAWWNRIKDDPSVRYFIFERDGRSLGVVNVVDIDAVDGTASWGYYLGSGDAPPGSGSAMEFLALEEIFERIGVRKLTCEVLAYNKPPLSLHAKFGFEREGYRHEHKYHIDHYEDVIELALFADKWPDVAERMAPRVFRD